jgi:hypothetical protein
LKFNETRRLRELIALLRDERQRLVERLAECS